MAALFLNQVTRRGLLAVSIIYAQDYTYRSSTYWKGFEKAGFKHVRTEGDHVVYAKEGDKRPIVIPGWQEAPVFIIKNNLRSAGLSGEDYFRLLDFA